MIMKYLFFFIIFLTSAALAWGQYPANPNKIRLGYQTTGDGLVYRGSGAPAYTPNSRNNAYMYGDTTNNILYYYENNTWNQIWPTVLNLAEEDLSDFAIVVDGQNQTPYDGIGVPGILYGTAATQKRITITVNGQNISFTVCNCN